MEKTALGVIDPQRSFYPAEVGELLGLEGFGELGVTGAEKINPNLDSLTQTAWDAGVEVFVTSDAHPPVKPKRTAHFAPEGEVPNFKNNWTVHCVDGTPGAMLYPDLLVAQYPERAELYIKGDVVAETPADDTSYTGALAHKRGETELLPNVLRRRGVGRVVLAGLAIGSDEEPLCVDWTARDFKEQGFDVYVVTDAVEAVFPENRAKSFNFMARMGIQLVNTAEARELLRAA